ncbi:MAG: hypothetical protein Q4C91_10395 [Eubacteriales bacterium]|nr:hypothetical protein [Eubacteriales bacterium]
MIDHMIAYGDIEPLIIVMPTFPTGGLEECRESALTDATEYFRYYMPMSSDCWELQAFGCRDRADETTEYLYDTLTASGYSSEDFKIFAAAGTEEFSGLSAPAQITSMKNYPDMFSYTERDFEDGNWRWKRHPEPGHSLSALWIQSG